MSDYSNPYGTNKPNIPVPPGYAEVVPPSPQSYAAPVAVEPKTSGLSIAGFVLVFFFPLIGVILCAIAWNQGKDGSAKTGLAKAGVWLGVAFMILSVLMFIFVMATAATYSGTIDYYPQS